MSRLLLNAILVLAVHASFGQATLSQLSSFADSLAQAGIAQKEIPGLGVVLIKGDSAWIRTYGVRNVEKNLPTDTVTLFQLGSVGKLFTIIAVLQQVEAGKLSLSADVNQYLEEFSLSSVGRPITLFDLLTHTAGLNDRFIGYLARSQQEVKPLGDHLKERMPTAFQQPGTEINYSNYSYALAGHLVELASGMKFTDYVNQNIFMRLGMTQTTYALPDNYGDLDAYAYGYRTRDTFEPMACYPRHATPAGSALSCTSDMAKFLAELMHPSGKLLTGSSMSLLHNQQFTNHSKLMGYTLGMEEQRLRGNRGIGKGGAFTGFISELVLFPDQDFGMFLTTNTQTDNFLEVFNREFIAKALPNKETNQITPVITLDLNEFAGTYRIERYNHTTVEDLLALYQGKLTLSKSDDGDLTTYQNGAWQHYQPVDALLFQNKNVPEQYLAFERNESGQIDRLYTNINIAGFYVPASLTPVAWYDDPVMINEYYFLVLVVILTFVFVPFFRLWVQIRRRSNPSYKSKVLVPNGYVYMALTVLVLYLLHFFGGFMYLARNVNDFYFGTPDTFRQTQQLTWLFPFAVAGLLAATIRMWLKRPGTIVFRVYYAIICLCAVVHLLFLYRWHFIGLHV